MQVQTFAIYIQLLNAKQRIQPINLDILFETSFAFVQCMLLIRSVQSQSQHCQNHNKKKLKTTYAGTDICYIHTITVCIERMQFKQPDSFVRDKFCVRTPRAVYNVQHFHNIAQITISNKFKQYLQVQTYEININLLITNKECCFNNLFASVQTQCSNRTNLVGTNKLQPVLSKI